LNRQERREEKRREEKRTRNVLIRGGTHSVVRRSGAKLPSAKMVSGPVVNVYPLSSYTFGSKEAKMEKDTSVADRLARMKQK
jgi:hypothetical protein